MQALHATPADISEAMKSARVMKGLEPDTGKAKTLGRLFAGELDRPAAAVAGRSQEVQMAVTMIRLDPNKTPAEKERMIADLIRGKAAERVADEKPGITQADVAREIVRMRARKK